MREDQVGGVSLFLQRPRGPVTGLAARHLGIEVDQPGMQALAFALGQRVGDDFHAFPVCRLLDPQGQGKTVMPAAGQQRRKVLVLARKVLVDKQDFHGMLCPMRLPVVIAGALNPAKPRIFGPRHWTPRAHAPITLSEQGSAKGSARKCRAIPPPKSKPDGNRPGMTPGFSGRNGPRTNPSIMCLKCFPIRLGASTWGMCATTRWVT